MNCLAGTAIPTAKELDLKLGMTADEILKAFPGSTEGPRTNMAALIQGTAPGEEPEPTKRPHKRDFVQLDWGDMPCPSWWIIPVWLASGNLDDSRKGGMARKAAVKKAVWNALGPFWKTWGPIGDSIRAIQSQRPGTVLPSIRLTRLGGRKLDRTNLWRSTKAAEDALAVLMGCDDGWTAWQEAFDVAQEPGKLWGLRIDLRDAPLPGSRA